MPTSRGSALRAAALVAVGALAGAGVAVALDDDPRVPYDPSPGDMMVLERRVLDAAREQARRDGERAPSAVECERRSGPGEERATGRRRFRCLAIRTPPRVRTPSVSFADPYSGFVDLDDGALSIRPFTPQHGM